MARRLIIEDNGNGVFTVERAEGENTHRIVQSGGFNTVAAVLNFIAGTNWATPAPRDGERDSP